MSPEDGWIVPAYHNEELPVVPDTPARVTWLDRLRTFFRWLKRNGWIEVEFDD